jgi:ParB-like chromosome segregation protein Spo0J
MTANPQLDLLPATMPEGELTTMPIDSLQWGFGPEPSAALLASVQRFGILQPVILEARASRKGSPGHWWVLDGRRRVLAARAAEQQRVPAFVLPEGAVNPQVVQLASHALRSRNRSAEVDAIQQLLKDGATGRDITDATGLRAQEIRALLPLLNLSNTLRGALREGKIAASVAAEVVKLPASAQRRVEDHYLEHGKVTMGDVREQRLARTQQAVAALDLGDLAAKVPDAEPPAPNPSAPAEAWDRAPEERGDLRAQALTLLRVVAQRELPEEDWYPADGAPEVRERTVLTWADLLSQLGGNRTVKDLRGWLKAQADLGVVVIPSK